MSSDIRVAAARLGIEFYLLVDELLRDPRIHRCRGSLPHQDRRIVLAVVRFVQLVENAGHCVALGDQINFAVAMVAIAGRTALKTSVSGFAEWLSKFQNATSSQIAQTTVLLRTPRKSDVATLMTMPLFS